MLFLYKLLKNYIGSYNSNSLKLMILKLRKKNMNIKKDKFDRIKFIIKSLLFPLINLKFKKKPDYKYCFIEPTFLEDEKTVQNQAEYIKYFTKKKALPVHWSKDMIISSFKDIFIFFKYYFRAMFFLIYVIFDKSDFSFKPLYNLFPYMILLKLIKPEILYLFNPHDITNYLLSLSFNDEMRIYYNFGNSSLFDHKRYAYFKNINIILCSKLHKDELDSYIKIGWIQTLNCKIELWGNESIKIINSMKKKKKYDLAFYSSGEWARTGWKRSYDINYLRGGIYNNNSWQYANNFLNVCIKFALKKKLKLMIYSHPHEKFLFNEHNILPPYHKFIDSKIIFCDIKNSTEKSNLFEAKIGVTFFSSILYDRLNYDMDTYFYYSPNFNETKFAKYLTKYSYLIYRSPEELKKKLGKIFNR